MPDPIDLEELFNTRYGDRGGYKMLDEIFSGPLKYEQKLDLASSTFRLSRSWLRTVYSRWRIKVGLGQ